MTDAEKEKYAKLKLETAQKMAELLRDVKKYNKTKQQ